MSRISTATSTPEHNLLLALGRYHYLTTELATRLLYSHGSLRMVQNAFRSLVDAGYCECFLQPRDKDGGSLPHVHRLHDKGKRYVRLETGKMPPRTNGRRKVFLDHNLAVAEFLIMCEFAAARVPGWRLRGVKHDLTLKRELLGEVIPDGIVELQVPIDGTLYNNGLALELDRGTEDYQDFWREKVRKLVRWSVGQDMTIAVVVRDADQPEKRATQLKKWTEAELASMGATAEGDLFRITSVPFPSQKLNDVDYLRHAFHYLPTSLWLVPFSDQSQALIDLGGGDA